MPSNICISETITHLLKPNFPPLKTSGVDYKRKKMVRTKIFPQKYSENYLNTLGKINLVLELLTLTNGKVELSIFVS